MEVLNAVGPTPLSVISKRTEPRKNPSPLSPISHSNKHKTQSFSRSFHGGLVLLSSFLNSELSKALTYEEALQQSTTSSTPDIDFNGFFENAIGFASENPVAVVGGLAVLAAPVVVSNLLGGKPKAWGVESAKNAYAKLGGDENAELVDIRSTVDIKQLGSPDIKGLKKKTVGIVYKGEDKGGFLDKLSLKFKEPENTTLFILDKFDGNSELVAELVTANGFKAAYAIKDGAEGPKGWKNSGLPWLPPKKGFSLDLSNLTDAFGEASDVVALTLGIAAAGGLGLLAFTEVDTILQVLGSAAIVQFVSKKLLFAEDRKQTIQQFEDILDTKVGPKEFLGDVQQIGKAFLPTIITSSKALPSPVEEKEVNPAPTDSSVQKPEPVTEVKAAPESTPEVNSVPKAEVQNESLPGVSRPLSPYPNYPDFKPPSSPIPSKP
ncbi:hypothetical protein CASFOL_041365 [Castilleja foliolosa]|uniref:Rhodanese-like domain-containing protein 4, chloroplastic n=1 Tax=Castilleja foliolosa TaxID=1961234 RepID=A0ABD3BEL9_9LAMI